MKKNIIRILIVVGIILLLPLVLTLTGSGVDGIGFHWTFTDFVFMGTLLFITGLGIDFVLRKIKTPTYRVLAVAAVVLLFLAVWTELAVGAVSQLLTLLLS